MATITPVRTDFPQGYHVIWEAITPGDVCSPISIPGAADVSLQAHGTWGGGTITFVGSNVLGGVGTFLGLSDAQGNAISITADGIVTLGPMTLFLNPALTGGTASDIDVELFMRSLM